MINVAIDIILKISRIISTIEIGAEMLNREFSVKLKLPPATVNNFDLVLCHCELSWEGSKKV